MQYRDDSTLVVQKDIYDKDSYAINWRLTNAEVSAAIDKNKLTSYGFVCSRPEYLQHISTTYNYTLQERKLPDGSWQNIATKKSANVIPLKFDLNIITTGTRITVSYTHLTLPTILLV